MRGLTYASDQDTHGFWRTLIDPLDLASGESTRLTRGNDYNEHPRIVDGKRLARTNVNRNGNPQRTGRMPVARTVAVSPAGDFTPGDVQDGLGCARPAG